MTALKDQGVDLKVGKQSAKATVDAKEDQLLVTTIPYEKGWSATIDGQPVEITAFQDAFVSIKVPAGEHDIAFSYLPQGLKAGSLSFVLCLALFFFYDYTYRKKQHLN